jgi:hypothetical protein
MDIKSSLKSVAIFLAGVGLAHFVRRFLKTKKTNECYMIKEGETDIIREKL